ncbi:MAG TPA: hypothetical protein VK553_04880, partial [Candidatus Nitrosopolaris rasttigaisensis]|nr:hypothetical protein [Candidatus Nitrosopolaris rasttigaisensis]
MKSHFRITLSVTVFVSISFALTLLISQNIGFIVIPFSIQQTKAIKQETSPPHSDESNTIPSSSSASPPSSSEGNTIPASSQSSTASPGGCINYNPSKRTITVSCNSPA